jgi:hypothetical protein
VRAGCYRARGQLPLSQQSSYEVLNTPMARGCRLNADNAAVHSHTVRQLRCYKWPGGKQTTMQWHTSSCRLRAQPSAAQLDDASAMLLHTRQLLLSHIMYKCPEGKQTTRTAACSCAAVMALLRARCQCVSIKHMCYTCHTMIGSSLSAEPSLRGKCF